MNKLYKCVHCGVDSFEPDVMDAFTFCNKSDSGNHHFEKISNE